MLKVTLFANGNSRDFPDVDVGQGGVAGWGVETTRVVGKGGKQDGVAAIRVWVVLWCP